MKALILQAIVKDRKYNIYNCNNVKVIKVYHNFIDKTIINKNSLVKVLFLSRNFNYLIKNI